VLWLQQAPEINFTRVTKTAAGPLTYLSFYVPCSRRFFRIDRVEDVGKESLECHTTRRYAVAYFTAVLQCTAHCEILVFAVHRSRR